MADAPAGREIRKRWEFADWSADELGWNQETGAPGIMLFASALQVWSIAQNRETPISIAYAAAAFNVSPQRIIEAVDRHGFMFVAGPKDDFTKCHIEHDGE